jgi:Flp pilus assembly protein TadD
MSARIERLVENVLWAIDRALPPDELVPMLEQLVSLAPEGSDSLVFAKYQLARRLIAEQPWRAARLAREVLADTESDAVWGTLGMAHTVLGNFRSAYRAHSQALVLAPGEPSHLHNLGHLLDVAFGRPKDALPYLRGACQCAPDEPELASSYAHALVRLGLTDRARQVLGRALHHPDDAEAYIARWASEWSSERTAAKDTVASKPAHNDGKTEDCEAAEG